MTRAAQTSNNAAEIHISEYAYLNAVESPGAGKLETVQDRNKGERGT